MNEKEKQIVPGVILADLKYLSVRHLYFNWFFNTGAETANQLIDAIIKTYLKSIGREDLIKKIRKWKGNETHNTVRIIEILIQYLNLDFDIKSHKAVMENIYKLYQNRYLDQLKTTGNCQTLLKDLDTIDYAYKYFRDRVQLSDEARNETLINKLFLNNQDIQWGIDNISLYNLFYRDNQRFEKIK